MTKLVNVNRVTHKNVKVKSDTALEFLSEASMVPVMITEFTRMVLQFPVVATRNSETGKFVFVALLGLRSGENLFWEDGKWTALFSPLNVSRQPFFIGFNGEAKNDEPRKPEDILICLDVDNPAVQEAEGEALFNDAGEDSEYFKRKTTILAELYRAQPLTEKFVEKLEELELLHPFRMDLKVANEESQRIEGLFTIDERKLKELPDETILELNKLGYMAPMHAAMCSLGHIYSLIERKNRIAAKAQA